MSWSIKFFQTRRGRYPVKDFIEKLNKKTIAKVIRTIELLEEYGFSLGYPHIKKINKNLYELRIVGEVSIRIFYTYYKNIFYIVHIFKKKSQKTPKNEIKIALDRIKELI